MREQALEQNRRPRHWITDPPASEANVIGLRTTPRDRGDLGDGSSN
jgi:hypothetical protein